MTALPQTSQPITKTRILDAAEKLFGQHGFEETSLRDLTAEAQVNLAAVNYHFQSKDSLIDAVIERRIAPVNRLRLEMLDAAGPTPTPEQIAEAFLAPMVMMEILPALPLIGRALSSPNHFLRNVYKKHLVHVVERFTEAIGNAVPDLPQEERFWRLQFMAGAMTHVLALSTVLPAMTGSESELDRQMLLRRLVTFLAAGLRQPIELAEKGGEN